jgi:RNA polymerase sigma-70 factor (ECF subfamily)
LRRRYGGVEGAGAVAEFFATVPLDGRLDRIRLVTTGANRQPALAAYAESAESGAYEAYGVMVFAIDGERIAGITGFPRQLELFGRLGLPAEIRR